MRGIDLQENERLASFTYMLTTECFREMWRSFADIIRRRGPRQEPCGTELATDSRSESRPYAYSIAFYWRDKNETSIVLCFLIHNVPVSLKGYHDLSHQMPFLSQQR